MHILKLNGFYMQRHMPISRKWHFLSWGEMLCNAMCRRLPIEMNILVLWIAYLSNRWCARWHKHSTLMGHDGREKGWKGVGESALQFFWDFTSRRLIKMRTHEMMKFLSARLFDLFSHSMRHWIFHLFNEHHWIWKALFFHSIFSL